MITLNLLHPIQLTPVQQWTFNADSIVRIGRSTDNHVVLYSAVVSRYHVEVQRLDSAWHIVSLGANGTYLDGKRIDQILVQDGMVIRLARSGPNIQIRLGEPHPDEKVGISVARSPRVEHASGDMEVTAPSASLVTRLSKSRTAMEEESTSEPTTNCLHLRKTIDAQLCLDCGAILKLEAHC